MPAMNALHSLFIGHVPCEMTIPTGNSSTCNQQLECLLKPAVRSIISLNRAPPCYNPAQFQKYFRLLCAFSFVLMQREAREHIQRRAALLDASSLAKTTPLSLKRFSERFNALASKSTAIASHVSRNRLLRRLFFLSFFVVFAGWVIIFRLISQQSYVQPVSGDIFISPPPLLLWRDYNPSPPPVSSSALSSCVATLHPLVGDWKGTCQQLAGLNIIEQPVCAVSPCSRPISISYSAAGFVRRLVGELSSSCSSADQFDARGREVIEVSSPLKYMIHTAAKSAWFHGIPYSVTGTHVSRALAMFLCNVVPSQLTN
jgi:hypothetical protein